MSVSGEVKQALTFDPEGHIYRLGDRVLPSVTQALNEWREVEAFGKRVFIHTISGTVVDGETMDAASEFGTTIHLGAKLIMTGQMDWSSLDDALIPPLMQFMQWMEDYKVKPLYIEQPMYSAKHNVAGTPDIIGTLQGFNHLDITDIKTGLVNDMVGPQTGGYEIVFREQEKYRKPILRHELILPRDGSPYKFNPLTKSTDGAFFLSRLFQWQYLNQ